MNFIYSNDSKQFKLIGSQTLVNLSRKRPGKYTFVRDPTLEESYYFSPQVSYQWCVRHTALYNQWKAEEQYTEHLQQHIQNVREAKRDPQQKERRAPSPMENDLYGFAILALDLLTLFGWREEIREAQYKGDVINYVQLKYISTNEDRERNQIYGLVQYIMDSPYMTFRDVQEILSQPGVERQILIENSDVLQEVQAENQQLFENFETEQVVLKVEMYQRLLLVEDSRHFLELIEAAQRRH